MRTMRIAQIVMSDATAYERKCQRVDFAALAPAHEVAVVPLAEAAGFDVAHVYAGAELPAREFRSFPIPYVASVDLRRSRWPFGKPVAPGYVASPDVVPEAVEERYFGVRQTLLSVRGSDRQEDRQECLSYTIGTFGMRRPGVAKMVELTLARIHRFRDDIHWIPYAEIPAPEDLAAVDLWVDPATGPGDLDGFVAEALVVGLPVVAARTPVNQARLEQGRTGFLVPPSDPNEMTHAILTALFKREVAFSRLQAATQTISKFRPRQRLRLLAHMYETLNS